MADNGQSKYRDLGSFVNEADAALAYDQAARVHHKDKAKLNFPDMPPQPQLPPRKTTQATSQYRGKAGAHGPGDARLEPDGSPSPFEPECVLLSGFGPKIYPHRSMFHLWHAGGLKGVGVGLQGSPGIVVRRGGELRSTPTLAMTRARRGSWAAS
jgi:hypothetical protein